MSIDSLSSNRDFVKLWSAQAISTFGSLITRTALPFLAILTLHATAGQIAVLNAANLVPGFLIGLIAGVWIDRLRRRPVMIVADLGRALVLAAIPVLAFTGRLSLIAVYVIAIIASALSVFFDVAEQSYIPSVVGKSRLVDANSRFAATASVAEVSAFGIAGWLVQWFTAPIAIAIDAITFVLSAGAIISIRSTENAPAFQSVESRNVWREMFAGVRLLASNTSLRALASSVAAMECAYGLIGTVFALYVLRGLGFQTGLLGLIYAVGGVVSLAASIYASRINRRLGLGPGIAIGLVLVTIGILFLPLARGAGIVAVLLLVAQQLVSDGGGTIAEINQTSLRQALAPPRQLGRINGGTRVVTLGATLLGIAIGGVLGQTIGYRLTIVVGALVMALGAAAVASSPVGQVRQ